MAEAPDGKSTHVDYLDKVASNLGEVYENVTILVNFQDHDPDGTAYTRRIAVGTGNLLARFAHLQYELKRQERIIEEDLDEEDEEEDQS